MINITTTGDTTILAKGEDSGNITDIQVSNNNVNTETFSLKLYDGTNYFYIINGLALPGKTSFVIDHNIGFDSDFYDLIVTTTLSTPDLTIIIK